MPTFQIPKIEKPIPNKLDIKINKLKSTNGYPRTEYDGKLMGQTHDKAKFENERYNIPLKKMLM